MAALSYQENCELGREIGVKKKLQMREPPPTPTPLFTDTP